MQQLSELHTESRRSKAIQKREIASKFMASIGIALWAREPRSVSITDYLPKQRTLPRCNTAIRQLRESDGITRS